jgi:hypothetical protein
MKEHTPVNGRNTVPVNQAKNFKIMLTVDGRMNIQCLTLVCG